MGPRKGWCYDGYRFLTYKHEPGNPHSLSYDVVLALLDAEIEALIRRHL